LKYLIFIEFYRFFFEYKVEKLKFGSAKAIHLGLYIALL